MFWSDELNCWMTCDPSTIIFILKSTDFEVINYKKETVRLAHGLGVDLFATANILGSIPLTQEGDSHAALRKQMAVELNQKSSVGLRELDSFAQAKISKKFDKNEKFDIASEIFAPFVAMLISELSRTRAAHLNGDVSISQVFDKSLSVNRRKLLNNVIGQIYTNAVQDSAVDNAGMRVAMMILGTDPLLGSIGESFIYSISSNPKKSMSEINWSDKLPITGVPYVERIANKSAVVSGIHVLKDERIRVYLDAFKSNGSDFYFGAGRHVCLGRAVSQQAWQILTSKFKTIGKNVSILQARYRSSDYVFNCPVSIEISVDE
ncbi:MAG: cytochrome P450 [Pseudomonadota bacterium]|nr:cytochrome P450 [Pseudomonadota bacterium]